MFSGDFNEQLNSSQIINPYTTAFDMHRAEHEGYSNTSKINVFLNLANIYCLYLKRKERNRNKY